MLVNQIPRHARMQAQRSLRRSFIKPAYDLARKVMPKISNTEAAALKAGTVGFDGDLFNGNPTLDALKSTYKGVNLSPEERSFMDNEVEALCSMIDDYEVVRDRDLNEDVWNYMKETKMFGMIIPKEYGGLGFSAHGHSQVVTKIASKSGTAAVSVMVPNSLGPGELLMRYGTTEQRDYFLPQLATGDMIPCFGLTGPSSGSDAASMRDEGVVCMNNGVLGLNATFKKRYITLAPVAGVVGLAINLKDPNGLLKGVGDEGITIALLERSHPGLRMGPRHDPLGNAFMNGTVEGENVFIPMSAVLGGQTRCGFGWNMLMDCLAEGRGISLPALSTSAGKGVAVSVGAYARIRKQFKVPIADMEGVQEPLARIAANAYVLISAQRLTNCMLNNHEQPAVLSAIMKQQMTHRMRAIVNDGMDVLGGAGICNGPNNFLANAYTGIPIAITVEGANILTRSLIQFGQGLTRSHPHLYHIIESIQAGNDQAGFSRHLMATVGHAIRNTGRSIACNVTRRRAVGKDPVGYYESQLAKLSANFALGSDFALTMGGKLKFAEFTSGRYADVLSNLFLGYAVLWHYEKYPTEDSKHVLDMAMQSILYETEDAFEGIFDNFPVPLLGGLMKGIMFPFGRCYKKPSDTTVAGAANAITTMSSFREQLLVDLYQPKDTTDRVHMLNVALPLCIQADSILASMRKNKRSATTLEQEVIDKAEAMREQIIQVDSFDRLGKEVHQKDEWTSQSRPAFASVKVAV